MIDGDTRVLGLIGHPLGHSLSPLFQNAILARAGLAVRYLPFPVAREADLEAALHGLAAAGVIGVNVTVPYKVAAARLCDDLSEEARAVRAVNTIAFRDGRLEGHNTDIAGFLRPLGDLGIRLDEREAVVLGAGGAARAVAFALACAGALVTVTARKGERAEEVAAAVESATEGHLQALAWEEREAAVARAALVVNATPVGQHPEPDAVPIHPDTPVEPGQVYYDLVYNPLRTRFLRMAEAAGARAVGGLSMLVAQGAAALEIWLGMPCEGAVLGEARRLCEEWLAGGSEGIAGRADQWGI